MIVEPLGVLGIVLLVGAIVAAVLKSRAESRKVAAMPSADRAKYLQSKQDALLKAKLDLQYGQPNPAMLCPHCQSKGTIRTKTVHRKKGISGGKATAALLTAGVSMLATGLARKEHLTQAHCANCGNSWDF